MIKIVISLIANEPAEQRCLAGEGAKNSAVQRMLYAEKFSLKLLKVKCKV